MTSVGLYIDTEVSSAFNVGFSVYREIECAVHQSLPIFFILDTL
jgi:hypothetical protein